MKRSIHELIRVPKWFLIMWTICMIGIIGYSVFMTCLWYYNEHTPLVINRTVVSGMLVKDMAFFDPEYKNEYVIQVHYKDTLSNYTVKLSNKKKDRTTKYTNNSDSYKIVVWSWKGGNSVKKDQLEKTINAVLSRLDHVPLHENLVALLMETAAVESHRGTYMTQLNNGPARGIYQMEYTTIIDTLNWLKKYHKDVYNSVQVFYNKKETEEWNYCYNVPWQTAMAITYYWRLRGSDIIDLCGSRYDRAMLYKLVWNTKKGKTTLTKYFQDTETYA